MISVLEKLGIAEENSGVFAGEWSRNRGSTKIDKISPIDGQRLASIRTASDEDYQTTITRAQKAFEKWRRTPGPVRGDTVRRLGNALRKLKHELGQLVTLETGKLNA
jgi:aldehyde dehydrogenase (NAD+)